MGSGLAKQYLRLGPAPILVHTLNRLSASPSVEALVLAVPPGDVEAVRDGIVAAYEIPKVRAVVPGGEHRQDSVFNALGAVDPKTDIVMIHDGVRPFIGPEIVERCLKAAAVAGGAAAGIPVPETVKEVDADGRVVATLRRERIWIVQTPQAFRYQILLEAHRSAREEGFYATDDAAVVERYGSVVLMVPGDPENIKITGPADLAYARWLTRRWRGR